MEDLKMEAKELAKPEKLVLSQIELMALTNLGLQERLIKSESDKLLLQREVLLAKVSARLGQDLSKYKVNVETGECILADK